MSGRQAKYKKLSFDALISVEMMTQILGEFVNIQDRGWNYNKQKYSIQFTLVVRFKEALEIGLYDVIKIRLTEGIIQLFFRGFLSHFSFHPSYLDVFSWRHTGHFPALRFKLRDYSVNKKIKNVELHTKKNMDLVDYTKYK